VGTDDCHTISKWFPIWCRSNCTDSHRCVASYLPATELNVSMRLLRCLTVSWHCRHVYYKNKLRSVMSFINSRTRVN
jgi:hypothetical protein